MRKRHKAEWTNEAISTYDDIITYPYQVWGFRVAQRLIDQIDHIINLTEQNPTIHPVVPGFQQIRKAHISANVSLYYRIKADTIELLYFWNNRRNPADNPFGQT